MSHVKDGRLVREVVVDDEKWESYAQIWLLLYEHKYGRDVTIYRTEADANEAALELIREYREGYDVGPDVTDQEAWDDWDTITDGVEYLDVVSQPIRSLKKQPT